MEGAYSYAGKGERKRTAALRSLRCVRHLCNLSAIGKHDRKGECKCFKRLSRNSRITRRFIMR